jgi:hypothetical protein
MKLKKGVKLKNFNTGKNKEGDSRSSPYFLEFYLFN